MQHSLRLTGAELIGPDGSWKNQHRDALLRPKGFEKAVTDMIQAWLDYAECHATRYESGIGEDGVLGQAWAYLGKGIIDLLNGDCGRLDCGTICRVIHDTLKAEGFDPDIM